MYIIGKIPVMNPSLKVVMFIFTEALNVKSMISYTCLYISLSYIAESIWNKLILVRQAKVFASLKYEISIEKIEDYM